MKASFRGCLLSLLIMCQAIVRIPAVAQGGYNDDRVMIEGFEWESHQKGEQTAAGGLKYTVDWQGKWYDNVAGKVNDLADAKFDLIWLPPPSQGEGAGYHPQQYFDFDNNYGTEAQQKLLLKALLQKGVEPVADIVINHRNGTGGWATFKNPPWPSTYICSTDEFWFQQPQAVTAEDRKILKAGKKGHPDYMGSDFWNWPGARDLDHSNPQLRQQIKAYLAKLKKLGYRGWRYDMVKGYDPQYVAEYDFASRPTFAVGEYFDGDPKKLTGWIDGTKLQGQPDPAEKACSAFDFAAFYQLREFINTGRYKDLQAITFPDNVYDGLVAINRNKAVTFIEDHDTGWPQQQFDSFANNDRLMQAYAFILTHPGVPCVYWKHYFDWNRGGQIKALIRARKYAGVNSGSFIKTELSGDDYVAIVGDKPSESSTLIVKIGNGFAFNPDGNVWELETSGPGYAVWVRKSKKQETMDRVDQAKPPFPLPTN